MEGMEGTTWSEFMESERARLREQRDDLNTQREEINIKLGEVDRELLAIEAYEATKEGRTTIPAPSNGRRGRRTTSPDAGTTRRGSKREELLRVIREGDGMTRGQILVKMNQKGNKAGEMSVSNALTALVKKNQITRDEKKRYFIAA